MTERTPPEPSAFMAATGLVVTSSGPDHVEGHLDLGPDHHQPWGIVHGGVYAAAVETAATVGAFAYAQERGQAAVGVHNATDFLRPLSQGRVRVSARPLQQGRTQQLWQVDVQDEADRLISTGRVRLAHVDPPAPPTDG